MGILTKKEILELVKQEKPLIANCDTELIQGATYDLRLGEEYIKNGSFGKLNKDKNPYLEIPQHDVVVVSTYENVNIPNKIVGRFGIRLGLTLRGILLSNEPQIDPGYQGKLFCILYNLSDKPITLTYMEHFATIEFAATESEALPYKGHHQNNEHIFDFVKGGLPRSGLRELGDDFEKLRKDLTDRLERLYVLFFTIITIILAILGILFARVLFSL